MFFLTRQERSVLLFLAAVIFIGSLLQMISKKSAAIGHFLEFTDQNFSLPKSEFRKARKARE